MSRTPPSDDEVRERLRQQAELSQSVAPRGLVRTFNPRWAELAARDRVLVIASSLVGAGIAAGVLFTRGPAIPIAVAAVGLAGFVTFLLVTLRRSRAGRPRTAADRARSTAEAAPRER